MINTVLGIDATHAEAQNIPAATKVVFGYVSGTSDIQWTGSDWVRFPSSVLVRTWQGYGAWLPPIGYDECDMETGALSPTHVPQIMTERHNAGFQWTTFYGSRDYLAAVAAQGARLPDELWIGRANCRLADWNLNETEAAALVGTMIEGMTCIGVQWASDASNPDTIVPGGTTTLAQTPMDLNAVDAAWRPSRQAPLNPPPPPVVTHTGVLVTGYTPTGLVERPVTSTDNGVTWK